MSLSNNYKYKYIDKVKGLVPVFYMEEDESLGIEEDLNYKVLGKALLLGKENSTILDVSGYTESEIQEFFIPENRNTNVTPQVFATHVLSRYGKTFSDFKSIGEFTEFVSGTIQPDIVCNNLAASFVTSAIDANYSLVSSTNEVHEDLVSSLGLMYMLNVSGTAGTTSSVSAILTGYITSSLFYGKTFTEEDGIKCLFEYVWRGREEAEVLNRYLPYEFQATDSALSSGTYTSGTQYLDNLTNLLSIWFNTDDRESTFIRDSFDVLDSSGLLVSKFNSSGPLLKFLKAISYGFYDLDNLIEEIADLLNIDKCPVEFLDYLANLIGWKFVGGDVDSWRSQLRQAVYVYKSKGTKQALVDAISYVFPRDITTFDASSDIKDAFESYLPDLIYYALKTESEVCQSPSALISFIRESQQNSDYVYNISNDHDKNIRFMVDAILQELDDEFKMIRINGVHYKDTPYYSEQPLQNKGWIVKGESVQGRGYEARGGYMLAIPPWENTRFYDTSIISKRLLTRLEEILTECNEGSRFEISDTFLSSLVLYVKDSIGIDTEVENFYFGNNNNFRFYTSSLEYAPNFDSVIANGKPNQVEVLDYWNTKSSNVFVSIDVGLLDESNGIDSLTPSVITNISQTLREFTPFHSIVRMYIGVEVEDDNTAAVDSILITVGINLDDSNTHILDSTQVSAWIGTSGIGNYYSSIDDALLKTGRVLPLPSDGFWSVFAGGVERDAVRRRDFKFEIKGEGFNRTGYNTSVPYYFFGSSLSGLENTKEFILKGYNYSGQHFIDIDSQTFSAVYDASNSPIVSGDEIIYSAPSVTFLGSPVSSTINLRGVSYENYNVPTRDLNGTQIYKVFVDRFLRLGKKDTIHLNFDPKKIQEIELGEGLHNLWIDKKDKFEYNLDGSGFYTLDHAFGPLLYNSTMLASGVVGNADTSSFNAYNDGSDVTLSGVQFTYIIGSNGIKDEAYRTHDSQLSLINEEGLVWYNGWNTYKHELDKNTPLYTNRSQLSGIEFSFPEKSDMICMVNYPHVVDEGCSVRRDALFSGVTFFSGRETYLDNSYPRMRFPLTRNKNYIKDSSFKETANWVTSGGSIDTFSALSAMVGSNEQTEFSLNTLSFSGDTELSAISGNFYRTADPFNLTPGESYHVTYEVSAENVNATMGWMLVNATEGKTYEVSSGTWVSSRAVNAPSFSAHSDWVTYSSTLSVGTDFNITDKYYFILGLESSGTPGGEVRIHTPILRDEASNSFFEGNDYRLSMNVDSSGFGKSNKVRVRLVTGKNLNDGIESEYDYFEYDTYRKRWMLSDDISSFKEYDLVDGHNDVTLDFHTDNLKGPLDLATRKLRTGKRYEEVHGSNTYYYLEIIPILPEHTSSYDLEKPSIRISNVEIINKSYIDLTEEYTRREAKLILEFLDTLPESVHSRNADISSALGLGSNGGSRLVYMEMFGGTNVEPDTTGTTYYNI